MRCGFCRINNTSTSSLLLLMLVLPHGSSGADDGDVDLLMVVMVTDLCGSGGNGSVW
jgi:hypothetical protein